MGVARGQGVRNFFGGGGMREFFLGFFPYQI